MSMVATLFPVAMFCTPPLNAGRATRMPPGVQMRVELSDAEWRERLRPEVYRILREEGTERPWSSPLNDVKERGVWRCAGCGAPLFRTEQKFESSSGWPSFWAPTAEEAVLRKVDFKLLMPRTEVRCRACGGHLGHVFSDGPRPTGQRYCINGLALDFVPAEVDPQLTARADQSFASATSMRRPPLGSVLPELALSGALVAGELVGFTIRLGPAAKAPWAVAALGWLPPSGPAGIVLLGFGAVVVARNIGLLLESRGEQL
jgi:peptide-methionine (R)-S-oxide reductase